MDKNIKTQLNFPIININNDMITPFILENSIKNLKLTDIQESVYEFLDINGHFELFFDENLALSILLEKNILILNSNWFYKTWPEDAQKTFAIAVNCSDTFVYASADAQELFFDELNDLYNHFIIDPTYGPIFWCIKKRKLKPLNKIYEKIKNDGIWDIDEFFHNLS